MSLFTGIWPAVDDVFPDDSLRRIAEWGRDADHDGKPPVASLDLLKEIDWPGLAIPELFHGKGAGLVRCCAAQRALGAADPGLAIAVNMHLFSTGLMVEHWRRRTDTSWLLMEAIATQNRLLASAFAEPGLGGSATRSTLQAEQVGDGWRVTGRKRPCSLAGQADLVCLQVQTGDEVLVALLPTTAPGLSVVPDWDALGMRGSASDTLVLEDCEIPDDLVFYRAAAGNEQDDVLAAGIVWFALTSTACYLGLAQSALELGGALLRGGRIAHLGSTRAELPSYQAVLGDPVADLLQLEAGCAHVAARMDAGAAPEDLLGAALAVKQQAIRVVPRLLEVLAEAAGGVSYARGAGFERFWRDAQAVRFHPPTPAATRQFLARRALGLPASLDLDEQAPLLRAAAGEE
ncbi:acyl-CoA dehydrogenase family protein [Lentzea sp. NPDC051838]|uniref:acyl-CoA dehydrogenase family protein n=1 Tax=Lentzea sp. NPDC051838 TaxID=3154849 RepID=UPI00342BF98F